VVVVVVVTLSTVLVFLVRPKQSNCLRQYKKERHSVVAVFILQLAELGDAGVQTTSLAVSSADVLRNCTNTLCTHTHTLLHCACSFSRDGNGHQAHLPKAEWRELRVKLHCTLEELSAGGTKQVTHHVLQRVQLYCTQL
jgi:hypothetical protein